MVRVRRIALRIVRLILHYIFGLIFAYGLGIWCIGGICYVVLSMLELPADSKAYITLHLFFFLGIPLGGPFGILFVDKLIFKSSRRFLWRILSGFLMGILGSAFVYWALPFLGIDFEGWFEPAPISDIYLHLTCGGIESFFLISVFFSLIGYNSVELFRLDKKQKFVD